MKVTVEISLYPLDKNYSPIIRTFIDRLQIYDSIGLKVQPASTLITGNLEEIMNILNIELRKVFDLGITVNAQIKIINLDLIEQ